MASAPNSRISTLQAGRGLAAIAVVAFHSFQYVGRQIAPLPVALAAPMSYGYLGVDFFFVLSGFIIYFTNHARASEPDWPARFLRSRLSRIYLPYWPIAIALGVAYMLLPQVSAGDRPWDWPTTLTLLPIPGGASAHALAWTLQHELVFYMLALLFLRVRLVLAGAMAAATAILVAALLGSGRWLAFPLIDLEFLFGIGAAWCVLSGRARHGRLLAAAGLLLASAYIAWNDRAFTLLFGLGVALILVPLVRLEQSGRIAVAKPWVFLGDASYAIYLIHLPLLSIVVRVAREPLPAAILCILASIAAGAAYHLSIERPLLAWARARSRRRGDNEAAVQAASSNSSSL
ncbi:MAG TPA: acyltransferase [Allosphingosinicella sp.]|nr:acyltransferase [Allosphingosinicella sp.]